MKRFGNLYHRIYDIDNLYLAYSKAKKGKGKTYGVIQFEKDLDNNILSLHKELSERSYITSQYTTFIIHDPKEREIYRLPFRDRVVHHAIMNILEDIWTPIFISHTYSCIKGKGIHWICFIAGKYSVWYNHGSLKEVLSSKGLRCLNGKCIHYQSDIRRGS